MEIISKIVTYTGFVPSIVLLVLFMICVIVRVSLYDTLPGDSDSALVILSVALIVTAVLCALILPRKHEHYRLRVNDSVTVKELSETYEIIEYDRDTDLWIVEKRKEE